MIRGKWEAVAVSLLEENNKQRRALASAWLMPAVKAAILKILYESSLDEVIRLRDRGLRCRLRDEIQKCLDAWFTRIRNLGRRLYNDFRVRFFNSFFVALEIFTHDLLCAVGIRVDVVVPF